MAEQMIQEAAGKAIPAGYKQTEVGVIPEDWGVSSLKDVAFFGGGTTPSRSQYDLFYKDGHHPWVKTLDLNNGPIFETDEYVTDAALTNTSLRKHKAGSVLVAMYGGFNQIGRTGLLRTDAAINQALLAIIPDGSKLYSGFLLSQLNYHVDYWKLVASSSRKDPNITSTDIKNYELPLPSVKEQTAIANVLSDSDALIGALEQLIVKKQAIKSATMQQLLTGRTRLPAFALRPDGTPKGYKPSELGDIPEDWQVVTVSDVLSEISMGPFGSDIKVSNFVKRGVPVLNGINVSSSKLVDSFSNFVTDEKAKELKKAVASRGDIVVTHRGTIGQISYIPDDSLFDKYVISQSQFRARFNDKVLPVWIVLYFLSPTGSARLLEGKGHTGVPAIAQATTTFRKLKFPLPSLEEQTAIATILSDMDNGLQALTQKLDKARALKQGMMQQLLTGKIRLIKRENHD